MATVNVQLGSRGYDIHVGRDLLQAAPLAAALTSLLAGRRALIVSDTTVKSLHGDALAAIFSRLDLAVAAFPAFPAGEGSKTLATVEALYHEAVACHLDRRAQVVAFGGGVVGDLAGFVAATFMRGLDFIQCPTTLLAMVDSSVGGKVGVDLAEGKNLVGAFHQPRAVFADLSYLDTLPDRELGCGLAEVVKYGVIMDPAFFAALQRGTGALLARDAGVYEDVIAHCCRLKAQVVAEDERETTGRRAMLNYGHTFGHALEVLGGYSVLNHGEGVAIGMCMAADLAVSLGLADPDLPKQQEALLNGLRLPTRFPPHPGCTPEAVIRTMAHDKKAADGAISLILPSALGSVQQVSEVPPDLLKAAIGGRLE